jgi:hypothetical protein
MTASHIRHTRAGATKLVQRELEELELELELEDIYIHICVYIRLYI